MHRCYLVCYDIREPKRLNRVIRLMKGYGEHWQYSIFFCMLKEIDRVRMQGELEALMNLKEDQALLIDLGSGEKKARAATFVLGHPIPEAAGKVVVI